MEIIAVDSDAVLLHLKFFFESTSTLRPRGTDSPGFAPYMTPYKEKVDPEGPTFFCMESRGIEPLTSSLPACALPVKLRPLLIEIKHLSKTVTSHLLI
jgi:hypothetical protein